MIPWLNRLSTRAACALCMSVMLSTSSDAHADASPRRAGPFHVLPWADGVTTSRSGYAVWVSLASTHHRLQLPSHEREVGFPEHRAALHVSCRAPGGALPDRFPPTAPFGGIYLDNHPEDGGAYTVLHPWYWVLALSGHAEERWPVEVRMGAGPPITSALVRRRIDYSAPRPGLDITLPGYKILDTITATRTIRIEAHGGGMRLTAQFIPSANAHRAAALMRSACPRSLHESTPARR